MESSPRLRHGVAMSESWLGKLIELIGAAEALKYNMMFTFILCLLLFYDSSATNAAHE